MKKNIFFQILILILLACSSGYLKSQNINYSRTNDLIYGRKDGMALTMDVFQPEKPNGIGVLLLISGGWKSESEKIETEWLARIKVLLDNNETVFAVIHSSMPKYKIPEIQPDIERAVRFVHFNAAKWNVDPNRLGIVGHSSGAHLSLLHAATSKEGDLKAKDPVDRISGKIQAVACFYPPTDFLSFGLQGVKISSIQQFKRFIPAFVQNPNDSTNLIKIAGEVSPIRYITNSMPPTLIITGDADKLVPFQQSQSFIDKLKELNIPCRLEIRPGKDHGWPGIENDYKVVAEWFNEFLKKDENK